MSEQKGPPGYIPLTIHELSSGSGNGRGGARKSDGNGGHGHDPNRGGRGHGGGMQGRSHNGGNKGKRPNNNGGGGNNNNNRSRKHGGGGNGQHGGQPRKGRPNDREEAFESEHDGDEPELGEDDQAEFFPPDEE